MKIVIAGAGSVGTHLARMLSNDNMDVVLIDAMSEKLSKLNNDLDIKTLCKSPTSIQGLKDAGVSGADLFIAVTPHENENLACAMLAKQLGAKKTVARVDSYEHVLPENQQYFKQMGIESLIYPELLAAQDIAASTKYSWARQTWEFNNGELLLLGLKMHDDHSELNRGVTNENNQLVGHTLKEIGMKHGHSFHVVAIKRNDETVAPHGDERILSQDLVFIMTTKEGIDTVKHLSGKDSYPTIKNSLVIGGTKLAVRASWALGEIHDRVKVIESDLARCEALATLVHPKALVFNGEGYDLSLLQDEVFGWTEAFIALTNNDQQNILACIAARRNGVHKTIAQVENMDYFDMANDLDVGTLINKKVIAASHIYRMLLKADVDNMKSLTVASADVAEFVVKAGSKVTKKPVMQLGIPFGVNIGGMSRNGQSMLVSGSTQLQEGDKVVVFCVGNTLRKLDKLFK